MSTNDVPGAVAGNADTLAVGCWAEHKDGSLIFVYSTEGNRVVYSIFDMAKDPPLEYRDAMPETSFKSTFSWDPSGKKQGPNEKWTWHDKTAFPWDRVVERLADGVRSPSAAATLNAAQRVMASRHRFHAEGEATAAERVADALLLEGKALDKKSIEHLIDHAANRFATVMANIAGAVAGVTKRQKSKGRRAGR